MAVTIQDIAKKLNINAATVSRALNDHPAISTKTKTAVRAAARKLRYRPNGIASSLRSGKSKILGVMIPSAEINFFGSVVHGIEKVANSHGYTVIIYQSNELISYEEKGVETFIRSKVDGVLVSPAKEGRSLQHLLELKERGIPLILFDRGVRECGLPMVIIDDFGGAEQATNHLLDQGFQKIAFIGGQEHVPIWNERLNGYKAALKKRKAGYKKVIHGEVSIASGESCTEKLMTSTNPPHAICCVDDFTALGALQWLKKNGLQNKIGIIGFANEAFGSYITPSLSTIGQHTVEMGEAAAKLFFQMQEGESFYGQDIRTIILPPELIIRESSIRNK